MKHVWVSGDEPLLVEEALDKLRLQARKEGFTREIFHVDTKFDWQRFSDQAQSLSLFSNKQFIECRLHSPKLSDAGKAALNDFFEQAPPDVSVVLISGKVESATQKTKWFKSLAQHLQFMQLWPLQGPKFIQWLRARAEHFDVALTPDALQYLAELTQGNLLAAKQSLERISLLAPKAPLDVDSLRALQHNASVYDIFDLVDCALAGKSTKTVEIFHQLLAQDTPPILMLWALNRETQILIDIIDNHATPYILPHRKALVHNAARRLTKETLFELATSMATIDAALKGMGENNPLDELLDLYLALSGATIRI